MEVLQRGLTTLSGAGGFYQSLGKLGQAGDGAGGGGGQQGEARVGVGG